MVAQRASAEEAPRSRRNVVGDVMSTDLFTVAPEDNLGTRLLVHPR